MKQVTNRLCRDIVLDSDNIAFRAVDSILGRIYEKLIFLQLLC